MPSLGDEALERPELEGPGTTGATLRTRSVRAGLETDSQHRAVVPPVHLSSNYTFETIGRPGRYDYTRSGNPTRDLLVDALGELEGAAGGVVTSTGMSAVTVALQMVPPGGTVIAPHDCYGGTHRLLRAFERRGYCGVRFVDLTAGAPDLEADGGALVWIETPSNPLLRITPLESVIRRAKSLGHRVFVDNTFLSPLWQRPIEYGADGVVHSTTKYLNGHSDVVGGVVLAADPEVASELAGWANCLGVTGSPFDAYLTLRGLRTLGVRLAAHEANAHRVVDFLVRHPAVERVHYPGLPDHPGHAVAARQQVGFGAMVSFDLVPARADDHACVRAFVDGLRHFSLAESLGGVESLVAHPATMTHASMDADARAAAGIGGRLVRLSIGIEDPIDLIRDLEAGLDRVGRRVEAR